MSPRIVDKFLGRDRATTRPVATRVDLRTTDGVSVQFAQIPIEIGRTYEIGEPTRNFVPTRDVRRIDLTADHTETLSGKQLRLTLETIHNGIRLRVTNTGTNPVYVTDRDLLQAKRPVDPGIDEEVGPQRSIAFPPADRYILVATGQDQFVQISAIRRGPNRYDLNFGTTRNARDVAFKILQEIG